MLSMQNFFDAGNVLSSVIKNTGLIYSEYLSELYGNNVYLKPENMQRTGSFKIRGAYYKISKLANDGSVNGVIASSAGNHAQGVAYGAMAKGIKATIVMPTTAPLVKVNNTKKYGAEVVLYGDVYDEAYQHAITLSKEHGYEFIHPFDDLDVAIGQGTIAQEILAALPEADIILVPVGGGGLAMGISVLAKLLKPTVRVIGVEPAGAPCLYLSLKNGAVTTYKNVNTIADGVAVQTPGEKIFPYLQANLDSVILVEDHELPEAFLNVMEAQKMLVENAGLLSVAALKHLNCKGKNVVSLLSGGNMDVLTMAESVRHGLVNRGRIFTFSVLLPDRPGELLRIASIIAKENGNVVKLEHDQLVNINRSKGVELTITLETSGIAHKNTIMQKLIDSGYAPEESYPKSIY